MMQTEQWHKWKPSNEFPNKIWFESLLHGGNGLKIHFESENGRKVDIIFEHTALSYRVTDEGDLLQTIDFGPVNMEMFFLPGRFINQTAHLLLDGLMRKVVKSLRASLLNIMYLLLYY